jgi:hypothetical protein
LGWRQEASAETLWDRFSAPTPHASVNKSFVFLKFAKMAKELFGHLAQ